MAHPWDHDHDGGHDHGEPVHLSHPLFTESPSPDTKIRLDGIAARQTSGEEEPNASIYTSRLEAEWAFDPSLSVELDVPYTSRRPHGGSRKGRLDTVSVGMKYARSSASDPNLLFGGGLELGLPTGDDDAGIGSNHVLEIEPFIDMGYVSGHWEFIGFTSFGVPVNKNGEDEADLELGIDLSALYHFDNGVQGLLELSAEHVFGGEEGGNDFVTVAPGIKFQPGDDPSLLIGLGVSLPVTQRKEFHSRTILSLFKHF